MILVHAAEVHDKATLIFIFSSQPGTR